METGPETPTDIRMKEQEDVIKQHEDELFNENTFCYHSKEKHEMAMGITSYLHVFLWNGVYLLAIKNDPHHRNKFVSLRVFNIHYYHYDTMEGLAGELIEHQITNLYYSRAIYFNHRKVNTNKLEPHEEDAIDLLASKLLLHYGKVAAEVSEDDYKLSTEKEPAIPPMPRRPFISPDIETGAAAPPGARPSLKNLFAAGSPVLKSADGPHNGSNPDIPAPGLKPSGPSGLLSGLSAVKLKNAVVQTNNIPKSPAINPMQAAINAAKLKKTGIDMLSDNTVKKATQTKIRTKEEEMMEGSPALKKAAMLGTSQAAPISNGIDGLPDWDTVQSTNDNGTPIPVKVENSAYRRASNGPPPEKELSKGPTHIVRSNSGKSLEEVVGNIGKATAYESEDEPMSEIEDLALNGRAIRLGLKLSILERFHLLNPHVTTKKTNESKEDEETIKKKKGLKL